MSSIAAAACFCVVNRGSEVILTEIPGKSLLSFLEPGCFAGSLINRQTGGNHCTGLRSAAGQTWPFDRHNGKSPCCRLARNNLIASLSLTSQCRDSRATSIISAISVAGPSGTKYAVRSHCYKLYALRTNTTWAAGFSIELHQPASVAQCRPAQSAGGLFSRIS